MRNRLYVLVAAGLLGCDSSPTGPDNRWVDPSRIDRLNIFVRNWPDDYVEIELKRNAGQSTLIIFRPPQPGVPRVLIDSIGPYEEDPKELADLLKTFNVWAMADSNATGAACDTRSGQWNCRITANDYSLVMYVQVNGTSRSQRYTRLGESTSNATARALGDYVFDMVRRRAETYTATHLE